jgi:hypothetical protein
MENEECCHDNEPKADFRWPYHAKVMKMLEIVSNSIVFIRIAGSSLTTDTGLRRKGIPLSFHFVSGLVLDTTHLYFAPLFCLRLPL